MAHEWIMGFARIYGAEESNREALKTWREIYGDDLGVALTDTYKTKFFFENIKGELSEQYAALKHDGECPFEFTNNVLAFYHSESIDPKQKGIVFSDGLTVKKAIALEKHIDGRTKASCGIGTHFTNEFEGCPALNIVIKLYSINGVPVAKISDNPDKASGDPRAIAEALQVI